MKISRIEAIPFSIPYRKPLRFASGEIFAAEHVLVRVHTDSGLIGTAEAPPRPFTYGETQASIIAVIDGLFAPQITGLPPLQREVIHARLNRTIGNPTAKAAIDMAVWDIIGQSLGVPVTDLLGGFSDRMRVSHMVGFSETAEMVAEAERMRDTYGITTFKVKVGRTPIARDIEACRGLRDGLGAGVEAVHRRQPRVDGGGLRPGVACNGRPRPPVCRGAVPRRRRARPAVARLPEQNPDVCRRKRVPSR